MEKGTEIEVKKKSSTPKKDFSNLTLNQTVDETLISLTSVRPPLEDKDLETPEIKKSQLNGTPKVEEVVQPEVKTGLVKKSEPAEKKVRQASGRKRSAEKPEPEQVTGPGPGRPEGKTYETVTTGMSFAHAKKLRDYVLNKKMDRDPFFTQRDAIEQALDLLFEKNPKYVPK